MIIRRILPLSERAYADRNNQPQVFTSQGFVLSDGVNTLYAETQGNYAKAALGLKLTEGSTVSVCLETTCRDWQDREGLTRYSNEVRITNISLFT